MVYPKKVLYSPGHGAGWATWNPNHNPKQLAEDPELIRLVEAGEHRGETTYAALVEAGVGGELARILANEKLRPIKASHAFAVRACQIADGLLSFGGVADLEIQIVNGPYRIVEHAGSEHIETPDTTDWW